MLRTLIIKLNLRAQILCALNVSNINLFHQRLIKVKLTFKSLISESYNFKISDILLVIDERMSVINQKLHLYIKLYLNGYIHYSKH